MMDNGPDDYCKGCASFTDNVAEHLARRRRLRFDVNILDLAPYGRQENWEEPPPGWPQSEPYVWWRLHDAYHTSP